MTLKRKDDWSLSIEGLVILTFGGGTNEMQRDLITMFGMGFPRADR